MTMDSAKSFATPISMPRNIMRVKMYLVCTIPFGRAELSFASVSEIVIFGTWDFFGDFPPIISN